MKTNPCFIQYDRHASIRFIKRALEHQLDLEDTQERVALTVIGGKIARKHKSRRYITYCRYFPDNLTFFVVSKKTKYAIRIKTVIIEHGRE
jgi:hypothetical protein